MMRFNLFLAAFMPWLLSVLIWLLSDDKPYNHVLRDVAFGWLIISPVFIIMVGGVCFREGQFFERERQRLKGK